MKYYISWNIYCKILRFHLLRNGTNTQGRKPGIFLWAVRPFGCRISDILICNFSYILIILFAIILNVQISLSRQVTEYSQQMSISDIREKKQRRESWQENLHEFNVRISQIRKSPLFEIRRCFEFAYFKIKIIFWNNIKEF